MIRYAWLDAQGYPVRLGAVPDSAAMEDLPDDDVFLPPGMTPAEAWAMQLVNGAWVSSIRAPVEETPPSPEVAAATALQARRVRMVCTPLQGRLVLGQAVCAQLDALASDPLTPWAMAQTITYAQEWHRLSPTMDSLAWVLGFAPEQMDALFEITMTAEA